MYRCPVCKSFTLIPASSVEVGSHSFYHEIEFALLYCPHGEKVVAIRYMEEERHGYPDSEHHIGCLIDNHTYDKFKLLFKNEPETLRDIPVAAPCKFEDFFPISFGRGELFRMSSFEWSE